MLVPFALFLCGSYIHHTADGVLLINTVLDGRCGMDGCSFRPHLFCVSDKDSEYNSFIKIIAQLSCRDGFGAVGCEIGQTPSAFFDSDTTAEKFFCKVIKANCF